MVLEEKLKNMARIVGANLRTARIECRKDVETVAKALDIKPDLLIEIENGRYCPTVNLYDDLLDDLCSYYSICPTFVMVNTRVLARTRIYPAPEM